MAAQLLTTPSRALDSNGSPYAGAIWSFYATGTITPQQVYSDAALMTSLGATVFADSGGKFPSIYFDNSKIYRGVLKSADGATTLHDIDPINSDFLYALNSTADNQGAGLVKVSQSAVYGVGTLGKRFQQIITPQDHPFLAVGDGSTDDTAALSAWINTLNSAADQSPGPIGGFLPLGTFKYTSALPNISSSVTIFSDNARQGVLKPVGNFDALTFKGASSRVPNCGLAHIRIDGALMTGGYGMVLDWLQDFNAADILISDAYNGISIRQCGDPKITGRLDKLRGTVGVIAQGLSSSSTARNGQYDKIDALELDLTIEGVDATATATLDACIIDGYVHTTKFRKLRALNCKSGLTTKNSAGLAQKYAPSLIRGWVEVENVLSYGMDIQSGNDITLDDPFVSSSATVGVRVGASVIGLEAYSLISRSNGAHGAQVLSGATSIAFYEPKVFLNGTGAAGIRDESGNARIYGGRLGGGRDGASETQAVGVQGTGATPTRVVGSDLTGNLTSAIANNVLANGSNGVSYTVATLPTGARAGDAAYVTDATATTFASTVAGGGANKVPVTFDGTNWKVG